MGKNDQIKNLMEEISNNKGKKTTVYSLNGCPSCEELKEKFEKLGIQYDNVEMGGNEKMWSELEQMGGSDFVPQVMVEGYLIKEDEYETVNDLIGKTLSNLIGRKIIIK